MTLPAIIKSNICPNCHGDFNHHIDMDMNTYYCAPCNIDAFEECCDAFLYYRDLTNISELGINFNTKETTIYSFSNPYTAILINRVPQNLDLPFIQMFANIITTFQ